MFTDETSAIAYFQAQDVQNKKSDLFLYSIVDLSFGVNANTFLFTKALVWEMLEDNGTI